MKSFLILLMISIFLFVFYKFSYNYFYQNKVRKEIKYLLLPNTVDLFYKQKPLKFLYSDLFDVNFDNNTKTFSSSK